MQRISVENNPLGRARLTKPKSIYYWVVAGWLGYAALTFYNPNKGTAKYNLSASQTNLLQLTVIIPVLLIWLIATYGAYRFRRYATTIQDSPDGAAATTIANGLLLLIFYLVFSTILSSAATFALGTGWVNLAVMVKNHLPILLVLVAFAQIYRGSVKLITLNGDATWTAPRVGLFLVPYCLFAVFFTRTFYLNESLHGLGASGLPTFALSNRVLLFTYVLPYLVVWLLGFLATLNIRSYAMKLKGQIYRSAFYKLALGIIAVVLFTILLQLLVASSATLNRMNLGRLLLLAYIIIIFDAIGYILIALGAKKLAKIEEAQ